MKVRPPFEDVSHAPLKSLRAPEWLLRPFHALLLSCLSIDKEQMAPIQWMLIYYGERPLSIKCGLTPFCSPPVGLIEDYPSWSSRTLLDTNC